MFDDATAFSSFAVPDVEAARAFYGDTLGLDVRDSREQGLLELHLGGPAPVLVYPKPDHPPRTSRSSTSRCPTSMPPSTA